VLVLGETSLFVAGAVLIMCLAALSLCLILRRSQRQKEVKVINISKKNAMAEVEATPSFGGEFYPSEGRVKNADRQNILQLATVLSISDDNPMNERETTPINKDEFYFTEVGENDQR